MANKDEKDIQDVLMDAVTLLGDAHELISSEEETKMREGELSDRGENFYSGPSAKSQGIVESGVVNGRYMMTIENPPALKNIEVSNSGGNGVKVIISDESFHDPGAPEVADEIAYMELNNNILDLGMEVIDDGA